MEEQLLTDMENLQQEWSDFRNRLFWTMIGFIGAILSIGIWVGTIQTTVANNVVAITRLGAENEGLESRVNTLEVTNGEIRARLSAIEAVLQEIKVSIKELR